MWRRIEKGGNFIKPSVMTCKNIYCKYHGDSYSWPIRIKGITELGGDKTIPVRHNWDVITVVVTLPVCGGTKKQSEVCQKEERGEKVNGPPLMEAHVEEIFICCDFPLSDKHVPVWPQEDDDKENVSGVGWP